MLHLFSRDEIFHWCLELDQQSVTTSNAVFELSSKMVQNFELLLKRGQVFCCFKEQENVRNIELFLDIANKRSCVPVNNRFALLCIQPPKLAQMDGNWHPWF